MYNGLSSLTVKSKSSNVPIESLIVKARDLNRRKRENRKARTQASRQAELAGREAMDDALKLVNGDVTSKGKLNVGAKPNSVFCGGNADSRGGVYRIQATKAPQFVMMFLPTSESNFKPQLT